MEINTYHKSAFFKWRINLFLLLSCLSIFFLGCSRAQKISITRQVLGTYITISVEDRDKDKDKAIKAVDSAFEEIERIESIFSVYKKESVVSKINRCEKVKLPDDVSSLLKKSKYFSEISGGAFDVTVYPLIELYRTAKKLNKIPSGKDIKERLKLVGYKNINFSKNIPVKEGTKLDFGGIAKGYASDKAVDVLKKAGIGAGIVACAGDIKVFGNKKFKIALANPRNKNKYITMFELKNKAVSTSGDYERYFFVDGKKIVHIVDPRTGYPSENCISATIITNSATDADALATAIFVLGPQKGLELIKKLKGTECLIIDTNKKIYKSKGLKNYEYK